jgi:hypothetical protein
MLDLMTFFLHTENNTDKINYISYHKTQVRYILIQNILILKLNNYK